MLKIMEAQDWVYEIRKRTTKIGNLSEANVDIKMEKSDLEERLKILMLRLHGLLHLSRLELDLTVVQSRNNYTKQFCVRQQTNNIYANK